MFLIEYFHCWPPLILYKLHCLGGVWIMWRQKSLSNPPLPPTPQFSTLSSPSPQVTCSMLVHTHMNEHGSGFTPTCVHTSVRVYVCRCVYYVYVRGRPPPIHSPSLPNLPHLHPLCFSIYCNGTSLPSFAFAISCYGNKGTDWSGCSSSESETQGEEAERERIFFFACKSWS